MHWSSPDQTKELDGLPFSALVEAAGQGDVVALAVLRKLGSHLAVGIGSFVMTWAPGLISFGGRLCEAGSFLLPRIQRNSLDVKAMECKGTDGRAGRTR